MTCIHGLDENNCPICRIANSTIPINCLKKRENRLLNLENPLFRRVNINQKLLKEISPAPIKSPLESSNLISKPNLINDIPNINDSFFKKRLNEVDITKSDKFGVKKRVKVKSPDFEFDKVDEKKL